MAAYGEFSPTEYQIELVRKAAESRPQDWPSGDRWRFVLPRQPMVSFTWQPGASDEIPSFARVETGLCWVEDVSLVRLLGFDWMLRIQAKGEDFLVRNGRFFKSF